MVRQTSAAFVALTLVLVACENEIAIPQVALSSTLTAQRSAELTDGFGRCPTPGGPWLTIGEYRGPSKEQTTVVIDGEQVEGSPVALDCSVVANGDKFDVDATAEIRSNEGGSVRITGSFSPSGVQTGVRAVFQRADYGQFSAQNCTVTYYDTTTEDPSTSFRGVAAGRVWGFLDCPSAQNVSSNTACLGKAQFRFENCSKGQ